MALYTALLYCELRTLHFLLKYKRGQAFLVYRTIIILQDCLELPFLFVYLFLISHLLIR